VNVCGIKWPFRLNAGRVSVSRETQHVKESLMQIIGMAPGEYLMKPDFGCKVHRRVFDPVNVMALAQGDIEEAIRRWEQRVNVWSVTATVPDNSSGQTQIEVTFEVKGLIQPVTTTATIGG